MSTPERRDEGGDTAAAPAELPGQLVFLRRLVTALTLSMIAGIVTIAAVVVLRFPGAAPAPVPPLTLPESISLPEGMEALAFTQGPDWWAVASAGEIAIFDAATGALLQRVTIRP